MPSRGLVIAIESYSQSTDLARAISGATASGEQFFDWLTKVKQLQPGNVYVCADGGNFPGAKRYPTNREAIVDAMVELVSFQDQTQELFVFFSGHGYCFQESLEKRAIDVLVAGDFVSAATSGTKCIKLQEVQEKLWAILGGQHHYYFVDACRTLVHDDEIDPIGLGRRLGHPAQRGRPTKYTFYSTAFGSPAAIKSDFAPALLDGLSWRGTAKGLTQTGDLWVQFPLLCNYVEKRVVTQKMDRNQDGNGAGLIVEITPIPTYTCAIEVRGAGPTDKFEARLGMIGNPQFVQTVPFQGDKHALRFPPGPLELKVYQDNAALTRVEPPESEPLEFFDDCKAIYQKNVMSGLPTAEPPAARVTIAGGANFVLEARNLTFGTTRELTPGAAEELMAGDYLLTLRDQGRLVGRSIENMAPGREMTIGNEPLDEIRESIARKAAHEIKDGAVFFSETLGPIGNRDLGLWLSLMGAAHITKEPRTFSSLGKLALDDVTQHLPNSSGVYTLAAIPSGDPLTVTVGDKPQRARGVKDLVNVFQVTEKTKAGPQLVTVKIGRSEARTFASYSLPNRLTFIVLSPGNRDQLQINQFLLPMYHLTNYYEPLVIEKLRDFPLRAIMTAYLFQLQFARSRAIQPANAEDQEIWDYLLYGKWLDPIMSLLACYEILRRGDEQLKSELRYTVIGNLDKYFPGLPDTDAIASNLGLARRRPAAPPLFREGLLAFPEWEDHLPISSSKLDFNYTWTTWRGLRH